MNSASRPVPLCNAPLALWLLLACAPAIASTPINDLGSSLYLGQYAGGLYLGGSNQIPADHAAEGLRRLPLIQPRNTQGEPDPAGHYVLMSIGMSNTTMEFSSFKTQAASDSQVNHQQQVLFDGARGSQTARYWTDTTIPMANGTENNYVRIRRQLGQPAYTGGPVLSTNQVQAVWVKLANPGPWNSLSSTADFASKDVGNLMLRTAQALRTMRSEYPNLQMVFFSSRIWTPTSLGLNPEPYAYEAGFYVKWLIEAQVRQMRGETTEWDAVVGDVRYSINGQPGPVPWLAWGPYLWADGSNPRSDGLTWTTADLQGDQVHPNAQGCAKVAEMMLDFFSTSPFTQSWFLIPQPAVAASYAFHNNSANDGLNPAANSADDGAILAGKVPLGPGQSASGANLTGYSRGLNGVMVDLANAPDAAAINVADFNFQQSADGATWAAAPTPTVAIRLGAGVDGSDRVTLIWADGAVRNVWLRVQVLATGRTGLSEPAVLYWGNLVGDTNADGSVNVFDLLKVQQNYLSANADRSADVTGDNNVNVFDLLMVRQSYLRALPLIKAP